MNDLQFLVFLPLAGVCFLVGAGLKAIGNETLDKFIPFLCGLFGGILGIVAFLTIPNFIPAENWLMALYVGVGSGLMATGAHQIYKQFTKEDTYDGVFEGEVPNEMFDEPEDPKEDEDPKDEPKEEE